MSRFVDFWSNLEEQNARLRLAFYTTLLVAGIEGWGLVTLARVPTPVYVVPGAAKSGLYRPNATWHEAARDFALSYALTVGNFTPESAPRSFALSQRYLAPALLSDVRATLEAELERIRRDRISAAFTPADDVQTTVYGNGVRVIVPGHARIYAGRELIREKPLTYELTIALVPETPAYPQGMQVVASQQREAVEKSASGKGARHDAEAELQVPSASPHR